MQYRRDSFTTRQAKTAWIVKTLTLTRPHAARQSIARSRPASEAEADVVWEASRTPSWPQCRSNPSSWSAQRKTTNMPPPRTNLKPAEKGSCQIILIDPITPGTKTPGELERLKRQPRQEHVWNITKCCTERLIRAERKRSRRKPHEPSQSTPPDEGEPTVSFVCLFRPNRPETQNHSTRTHNWLFPKNQGTASFENFWPLGWTKVTYRIYMHTSLLLL